MISTIQINADLVMAQVEAHKTVDRIVEKAIVAHRHKRSERHGDEVFLKALEVLRKIIASAPKEF